MLAVISRKAVREIRNAQSLQQYCRAVTGAHRINYAYFNESSVTRKQLNGVGNCKQSLFVKNFQMCNKSHNLVPKMCPPQSDAPFWTLTTFVNNSLLRCLRLTRALCVISRRRRRRSCPDRLAVETHSALRCSRPDSRRADWAERRRHSIQSGSPHLARAAQHCHAEKDFRVYRDVRNDAHLKTTSRLYVPLTLNATFSAGA